MSSPCAIAKWNPPPLKVGDTYASLAFQWTNKTTGAPINFPSGATALAQIRDSLRQVIFTWDSSGETSDTEGVAAVSGNAVTLAAIPAETTQKFPSGQAFTWELQVTLADGTNATQLTGTMAMLADLAR